MEMNWRKSSYSSGNGGNCVEVGNTDRIVVRDSKDPEGPKLAFTPEQWRPFTRRIRDSK
jgi:hypothetical protein